MGVLVPLPVLLALPAAASSAVPYTPSSEYPSSLLPQGNDAGPAIGDQARRKAVRRKRRDVPVLASFQVSRTSCSPTGSRVTSSYARAESLWHAY